jgi:hypothetical protein
MKNFIFIFLFLCCYSCSENKEDIPKVKKENSKISRPKKESVPEEIRNIIKLIEINLETVNVSCEKGDFDFYNLIVSNKDSTELLSYSILPTNISEKEKILFLTREIQRNNSNLFCPESYFLLKNDNYFFYPKGVTGIYSTVDKKIIAKFYKVFESHRIMTIDFSEF